jgi:hypothetical protein
VGEISSAFLPPGGLRRWGNGLAVKGNKFTVFLSFVMERMLLLIKVANIKKILKISRQNEFGLVG